MKIPYHSCPRCPSAFALVVVMVSLAVMLLVFASVMYWSASSSNVTTRNNLFTAAQDAAESGTENILAHMIRDFTYGSLNAASSYNLAPNTTGWPVAYTFTDTNGGPNYASVSIGSNPTNAIALNSQFAGLYGFALPVTVTVCATPQNVGVALSASVSQTVNFALIPLFQFAIFYNMDLEFNPGAAMSINGQVHCNNNMWVTGAGSGSPLTFSNAVEAAGTISNTASPLDPRYPYRTGGVTYMQAGMPLMDYTSMNLPIGGSTNNNPTNVTAILNPAPSAYAPPNYSAAYSTNGLVYFANAADLIVSNAVNGTNGTFGTNLVVYYQNPNNSPNYLQQVPGDVLVFSNVTLISTNRSTNTIYAYSWVTNASYYDYRESNQVQAVQIDVGAFNNWLANTNSRGGATYNNLNNGGSSTSKNHAINAIYVQNEVPNTSTVLPAVRMVDGAQLPPGGLTVATAVPMYVKGNYNITTNGTTFSTTLGNTANTEPAALLADAITILSANWSDTNQPATTLAMRNPPASLTINAAMLEGIVPSNGVNYSGGVENFMRLLEDWSGQTITYNGSIVVMFPSQYATNPWQNTGIYYNPPTRNWGFDLNFMNPAKLPPLTPTVKAIIRGSWSTY